MFHWASDYHLPQKCSMCIRSLLVSFPFLIFVKEILKPHSENYHDNDIIDMITMITIKNDSQNV